jgi:uncharacterized repeat protein (TIGR03803 family)
MRASNLSIGLRATLAILTLVPFVTGACAAQQETVLHSFGNPATQDGAIPYAGLIFDAHGNLYGTTSSGGIHPCNSDVGCGTLFELSPREGVGWTEAVLHSFDNNGSDGNSPQAGVIFDGAGNLYGTTQGGGIHQCEEGYGCGTVFELMP